MARALDIPEEPINTATCAMANLLFGVLTSHSIIPDRALREFARLSLAGFTVHLCLHRVLFSPRGGSHLRNTEITAVELDRLLTLLGGDAAADTPPAITASFDDGYADAVEYVRTRHSRFPNLNWEFFICPAKTRDRVGFRWDRADTTQVIEEPFSVEQENRRADLSGLADRADCRLATVEQLRELVLLPRVALGNHTNCHFPLAQLDVTNCAREIHESRRDFAQLFGETRMFAFPFGVEGMHFGPEHVEMLTAEGYSRLYSVEPRPIRREAAQCSGVIPRFAVMGTWPSSRTALYISLVALREKVKHGLRALRRERSCR